MRSKLAQANIDNTDPVKYPNGRIKDNTGAGDGTPVNEEVYGDFHEMKDKLMRLYGLAFNGLPDNETNGYQFIEALRALSNKNDIVLAVTLDSQGSGSNNLSVGVKLGFLLLNESFTLKSSTNIPTTNNVTLRGTDNVTKNVTTVGSIRVGDYVRMINTSTGILMVKVLDFSNIDSVVSDLGYLKGATQAQEDSGTLSTVATTPVVNKSTFTKRVIGALSGSYLASVARNGLMSQADKIKLDGLENNASGEERRGFLQFGDPDVGSVGQTVPFSGQISAAQISERTSNGKIVTVTLDPPLPDNAYFVHVIVQSVGGVPLEINNDIKPPVYERINASTFKVYLESTTSAQKNLLVHLRAIKS